MYPGNGGLGAGRRKQVDRRRRIHRMDHHAPHLTQATQTAGSSSSSPLPPEHQISLDDDEARIPDMRRTHTRPLSNVLSLSNMPFIDMFNISASSSHTNATHSSSSKQKQVETKRRDKPTLPILRWFNNDERTRSRSQPSSPAQSSVHLPMSEQAHTSFSTPTTPVSVSSVLVDALQEDPALTSSHSHTSSFSGSGSDPDSLPSRPEKARLPPSFRPSVPPSYLSNLTRSTLPTSCLSPPQLYSYTYTDPFQDPYASADLDIFYSPTPDPTHIPHSPAPAHLPQSSASRPSGFSHGSSLDSLKSIHERGRTVHERSRSLYTSAPTQLNLPGLPTSLWSWFNPDEGRGAGKENIRPLLNEEDRGANAEDDRERIRKKCQLILVRHVKL